MSRRTTQQSKTDELAFPVRVKIAVPGDGLGRELSSMREWLQTELGSGQYAVHAQTSIGCNASAYYFRTVSAAQRFLEAFPGLQFADGTQSPVYRSASKA